MIAFIPGYATLHGVGASAGDTVLLAGKGPEDTLERDGVTVPWDEVAEAREALTLRG